MWLCQLLGYGATRLCSYWATCLQCRLLRSYVATQLCATLLQCSSLHCYAANQLRSYIAMQLSGCVASQLHVLYVAMHLLGYTVCGPTWLCYAMLDA